MKRLKRLEKTCNACPSQWDLVREDGLKLYIRYRFGILTVKEVNDCVDSFLTPFLIYEQIGEEFDGIMSTYTMLNILNEHNIIDYKLGWHVCGDDMDMNALCYHEDERNEGD